MKENHLRVLFIEDNEDDYFFTKLHMEQCGYVVDASRIDTTEEVTESLRDQEWDVIICDYKLKGFNAQDVLSYLKGFELDIPIIVVSGEIGEETAVELMRTGAHDYLAKGNLDRLEPIIVREMAAMEARKSKQLIQSDLEISNKKLRNALAEIQLKQDHIGHMQRLKELGEMTCGVAHDFNNSLSKISGMIELMEEDSSADKKSLSQVNGVVKDAVEIVKRLRGFYKPRPYTEMGDPVDLATIIQASIDMTQPRWEVESQANGHPIQCVTQLEDIPMVIGISGELHEAFTNLIFNACDAMPDGGTITISSGFFEGEVWVCVQDTGVGMNKEQLEKCLEPFFTTKGDEGSGLGLGLVDAMMHRYGGRVEVDSVVGMGSRILLWFSIPDKAASKHKEQKEEIFLPSPSMSVMVVDDDPDLCFILQRFLELDGHSVCSTANGEEALAKYQKGLYDVILTDLAMPIMNGEQLASKVSALDENLSLILMTSTLGILTQGAEKSRLEDIFDFILPKPVTRNHLREALCHVTLNKAQLTSDNQEQ